MLKNHSAFFRNLHIASDILLSLAALLIAYWLRFHIEVLPVTKGYPGFEPYFILMLPITLIWFFIFKTSGLYLSHRTRPLYEEFTIILIDIVLAFLCLLTFLFFYRQYSYSMLVMGMFFILNITLLFLFRAILRSFLSCIRKRGYNKRYILIVGTDEKAWDLTRTIERHQEYGMEIIGYIRPTVKTPFFNETIRRKTLGVIDSLPLIIKKRPPDLIFITLSPQESELIQKIIDHVIEKRIEIKILPDVLNFLMRNSQVEDVAGMPVLNIGVKPISQSGAILKRLLDISISTVLLILSFPLFVVIATGIKISSRGPVFYRQERVGLDGTSFTIYKFRSMHLDAEKKTGPIMVNSSHDRRCFPLGAILRRTNLDEIPQLINILKGEMSLVGPRPERPYFIKQFKHKFPRYLERHRVKCGITGWAQINGLRGSDTEIDKRLEYDLFYIENWSLLLDLEILIGTLFLGWRNAR